MKICISIVTTLFLCASFLQAQVVEVVTEEWKPYNYIENETIVGFSTEVMRATLAEAQIEYNLNIYPWAWAYGKAKRNKNCLIYTISRTDVREKSFHWIGPIAPRSLYLFALKKRTDIDITDINDVKKYKVGAVRKDSSETFLLERGFVNGINLISTGMEKQNVTKLYAGEIDFIVGTELTLGEVLEESGHSIVDLKNVLMLIDKGGYYMAYSKNTDEALVTKTKKAFEKIVTSGKLKQIKAKFFTKP